MSKIITLVSNCDDWEGCYIDGNLIEQGHSIRFEVILEALGYQVEFKEVSSNWLYEIGHLPDDIEDVEFL